MAYVLDTSAVLTLLLAEPGYETVVEVLDSSSERDEPILLPFMTLMEMQYRLLRSLPEREALQAMHFVEAWPAEVAESDPAWRSTAARIKAKGGLSLADAWIAALALQRDAVLVHKDPEFDKVEGLQALTLPNA